MIATDDNENEKEIRYIQFNTPSDNKQSFFVGSSLSSLLS